MAAVRYPEAAKRLMVIIPADLEWRDGLPWSRQFEDIYFSVDNGLAEKRHVFLEGNCLPQRFASMSPGRHFTIAETGFGTGLNFLAAWQLWEQTRVDDAWLHFVSVEMHPLKASDLQQALALWPELAAQASQLLEQYPYLTPGWHRLLFPAARVSLTLLLGEASLMLPDLNADVDAWFLDGFSPDRNPELWQLDILGHTARLGRPGTTAATYTCAGAVKRALESQGFRVERVKGFGRKREMIIAEQQLAGPCSANSLDRPRLHTAGKRLLVVGAGIAGISSARAFARRGWQVTLAEKEDGPGAGASGNPAAIIYPKIAPPHLSAWHFQQQGYLWLRQQVKHLPDIWRETGLLLLLAGNQLREGDKLPGHPWHPELVQRLDAKDASALAGVTLTSDCLHFPQAGFLHPDALYRAWLDDPRIDCRWQTRIDDLQAVENHWLGTTSAGETLAFDAVILANALDARNVIPNLPVYPVRGQISLFPGTPGLSGLKKVLCYGGYVTPAFDGGHCMGASFVPHETDTDIREEDHLHNRHLLKTFVPALAPALPPAAAWQGRASLRAQSQDYQPLVGRAGNRPGLYLNIGHGSKGFCFAPLAAEILAAELNGEPFPVPDRVLKSLHPGRFARREARRQGTALAPS